MIQTTTTPSKLRSAVVDQVISFRTSKTSSRGFYFDFTSLVNNGEFLSEIVTELLKKIDVLSPDVVVGSGYGGCQLCSAVVAVRPNLRSIIIRDLPHEGQSNRKIEGDTRGVQKAIFIDDAVFTGETILNAVADLATIGIKLSAVVVIYDNDSVQSRQLKYSHFPIYSIFNRRNLGITRDSTERASSFIGDQLWAYYDGNSETAHLFKSTPVVHQGLVINATDQYVVRGHDLETGAVKWELNLDTPTARVRKGITQDLKISSDGHLYVAGYHGCVHKINPLTGSQVWSTKPGSFIHATPVFHRDRIFVNVEDYHDAGHLSCIDPDTGHELWVHEWSKFSPNTVLCVGELVIATCNNLETCAFNCFTGELLWKYTTESPVKSDLLHHDGVCYLVDLDGWMHALTLDGNLIFKKKVGSTGWRSSPIFDGTSIVVVESQATKGFGHVSGYDPKIGSRRWLNRLRSPGVEAPIKINDLIAVFSKSTQTVLIDQNGDKVWDSKSRCIVGGTLLSKPVISNGIIAMNTLGAGLQVFRLAKEHDHSRHQRQN